MKKSILVVSFLFAIFILFSSCAQQWTQGCIDNKSSYAVKVSLEFTNATPSEFELQPNEKKTFSMYAGIQDCIKNASIGRWTLTFPNKQLCVIKNTAPTTFKIINTTDFKIKVSEKNNMFDTVEVEKRQGSAPCKTMDIPVYSSDITVYAETLNGESISLTVILQNKNIIVKL